MTRFDHLLAQPQDDLDRRFAAALLNEPKERRAQLRAIWSILRNMDRTIETIRTDVRDCNLILARTIDRMLRFNASGMPADA